MKHFIQKTAGWVVGVLLLAVMLPAIGLTLVRGVPVAHAGGSCSVTPCIHWSSSMIYAGQNNGYPEGPVGEHVAISGEGFTAFAGQNLLFWLAPGDVNNPSGGQTALQYCQSYYNNSAAVSLQSVTTVPASDGTFSVNYDWPSGASSGQWSICAYLANGTPTGNIDDGPFKVLSANPPAVAESATSVAAGGSVKITGTNWLPAQSSIFVYIGPCADCGGTPIASDMATSAADGTFSLTLNIPPGTTLGNYIVSAHNASGVLDVVNNGPHIVVTPPQPTPTAQPTATPKPTATTVGAGGGLGSSSTGTGGGNSGLLIGLAIVVILLLAALAGLVTWLVTHRGASGGPVAPGSPGHPYIPGGAPFDGRTHQSGLGYGGHTNPPGLPYGSPTVPPAQPYDWRSAAQQWDAGQTVEYPGAAPQPGHGVGSWPAEGDDSPTRESHLPPFEP